MKKQIKIFTVLLLALATMPCFAAGLVDRAASMKNIDENGEIEDWILDNFCSSTADLDITCGRNAVAMCTSYKNNFMSDKESMEYGAFVYLNSILKKACDDSSESMLRNFDGIRVGFIQGIGTGNLLGVNCATGYEHPKNNDTYAEYKCIKKGTSSVETSKVNTEAVLATNDLSEVNTEKQKKDSTQQTTTTTATETKSKKDLCGSKNGRWDGVTCWCGAKKQSLDESADKCPTQEEKATKAGATASNKSGAKKSAKVNPQLTQSSSDDSAEYNKTKTQLNHDITAYFSSEPLFYGEHKISVKTSIVNAHRDIEDLLKEWKDKCNQTKPDTATNNIVSFVAEEKTNLTGSSIELNCRIKDCSDGYKISLDKKSCVKNAETKKQEKAQQQTEKNQQNAANKTKCDGKKGRWDKTLNKCYCGVKEQSLADDAANCPTQEEKAQQRASRSSQRTQQNTLSPEAQAKINTAVEAVKTSVAGGVSVGSNIVLDGAISINSDVQEELDKWEKACKNSTKPEGAQTLGMSEPSQGSFKCVIEKCKKEGKEYNLSDDSLSCVKIQPEATTPTEEQTGTTPQQTTKSKKDLCSEKHGKWDGVSICYCNGKAIKGLSEDTEVCQTKEEQKAESELTDAYNKDIDALIAAFNSVAKKLTDDCKAQGKKIENGECVNND